MEEVLKKGYIMSIPPSHPLIESYDSSMDREVNHLHSFGRLLLSPSDKLLIEILFVNYGF